MAPWPGFIYLYHIYALCYDYEQVVLYCDCYVETCLVSFHASRIYCYLYYCVLLIYCDDAIYALCRLFPIPFFWLLYYSVGFVLYNYGQLCFVLRLIFFVEAL